MTNGVEIIFRYFPELSEVQKKQFSEMFPVYAEWNEKINVISRKDFASIYEKHVLHSLAIAKLIQFKDKTKVLDLGTGGGFPGIPLAVFFPEVKFHLVDSIGKKIQVVEQVVHHLAIKNVTFEHSRVENIDRKFDFVVSRAVAPLSDLVRWTKGKFSNENSNELPNGIICLKGGDLEEELKPFKNTVTDLDLKGYFEEEFFVTKKIVYLPNSKK
ncbi:MAG: 16S rRNA (guanine(527)-N(7))-methyltransferase RsmG [Cytophagales bacterium]